MHHKIIKSHKKCSQLFCLSNKRKNGKVTLENVIFLFVAVIAVVNASDMCKPALNQLVKHGVATPDLIHYLPNNGSEVCRGGPCCMPSMSDKMLSRGRHLLHSSVYRETTSLLEEVTSARDSFRGTVEAALHRSEQRTLETFRISYPRLIGHAKEPLRELFASLHSSMITTEDDTVDRALDTFWDDLFPLVYHSTVHSRLAPFTHGYMECLRKSRKFIKPWKVVPSLIGQSLVRGMETARLMVTTLNVASDVLLNARQYEIPEECGKAAARLYFCGSCHAVLALPCSGFCLNVARGCLAPLAELNMMWNSLGTSAGRIDDAIRLSGLARLLKELPEMFSDAIMVAMESSNKLQKLVRNKCGPYSHEPSSEWEARTMEGLSDKSEASLLESDTDVEGEALNLKAKQSALSVTNSHNYWRKIADNSCSKLALRDTDCWNGDQIASYNRQVARVGVSAQKYNPEVQVSRPDSSVYILADKMRNVKRTITKVLSWMPESASSVKIEATNNVDGSGFGSYANNDDEDGEDDGLGSGSYPPKTNTNSFDQQGEAPKMTTAGAASTVVCWATVLIFVFFLRPNSLIL